MKSDLKGPGVCSSHPLDREIDRKKGREAILKACSSFFLVLFAVLLSLYFTLPAFQVRGIHYHGMEYLSSEDVQGLVEKNASSSLLFVGEKDIDRMSSAILKGTKGLFGEVTFKGNMFGMDCFVKENYPLFALEGKEGQGERFLLSNGKFLDGFEDSFLSCSLGKSKAETVLERIRTDCTKAPLVSFEGDDEKGMKALMDSFDELPFSDRDVVFAIDRVLFHTEETGKLRTMDILLSTGDYLIEGIPIQETSSFFKAEFFSSLLDCLGQRKTEKTEGEPGLEGTFYRFRYCEKDGEETYVLEPIGGNGEKFDVSPAED